MSIELFSDSVHVILGNLAQTAHHVIHILDRKIVLGFIQSRQKCFQFSLDIGDSFLIVCVGLIIALLDMVPRLIDYLDYLFAIFINLFVALFVVFKLGLRSFDGKERAHLLLGLLDPLSQGNSILQIVFKVMGPMFLCDCALRTKSLVARFALVDTLWYFDFAHLAFDDRVILALSLLVPKIKFIR